jgi:hypothetical protein
MHEFPGGGRNIRFNGFEHVLQDTEAESRNLEVNPRISRINAKQIVEIQSVKIRTICR